MTYTVTMHDVEEQTIVSIRARVPEGMLPAFFTASLARLSAAAATAGTPTRGAPLAIHHGFGDGGADIEVAYHVADPVTVEAPVTCRTLPAMRVARTEHLGSYGRLAHAYGALTAWIAEHGYLATGPVQEHYLTGPGALPENYWTVVDVPIAPALIPVPA